MEDMETAGKKLFLIEPVREAEDSQKTRPAKDSDANPQISVTEKNNLFEVSRRIPEDRRPEDRKLIGRNHLVNKLNFINFQDSTLLINFKHRNYHSRLTLLARPHPCLGDTLDCFWEKSQEGLQVLDSYQFQNILIPDGQNLIQLEPEIIRMDKESFSLRLPDNGFEVSSRKVIRYGCKDIKAQVIQNSTVFSGMLVDFNACSLKIELKTRPPQTFEWINSESPVNLILSDHK
jgi:hypothetical protein